MAERHLYTYETSQETKTGAEFIKAVQWLWTEGRSSVWSRALSLINNGEGIAPYGDGSWTQTNTYLWGGGGGWNLQWASDDGLTNVESVQKEFLYNKTDWIDGKRNDTNSHKITAANGDSYNSTFYYESHHKLLPNGTTYIGGNYLGGHTIKFTGISGTPSDTTDDELAEEAINWTSNVTYNAQAIRNENIVSDNRMGYENSKYKFGYDTAYVMNWGVENQVNPLHVKKDASQQWVMKNVVQTFNSYSFEDKATGFKFQCKLKNTVDFVNNTAKMEFTDIVLYKEGIESTTKTMTLTMTAAEIDQINMGEEIGDDLGGIESHITNIVLPYINQVTEEATEENNSIAVKEPINESPIDAGGGNDTVSGASGDDTIDGGEGNDSVVAGAGTDEIDGGDGADKIAAGEGNDDVVGGAGNDSIDGGNGDDILYAGEGNDSLVAGAGTDEIDGGDGADKIVAGEGNDDVVGGGGNDALDGGNGDDILYSGDGNDSVVAGDGADLIVGGDGAGNDSYDGGKGIDSVKYTSAKAGIRVDLAKGTAASVTAGDAAGIGTDKLKGVEYIISGDFADILIGSKDANSILGGDGADTIDGGLGNDTLVGGNGADVFVFSAKPDAKNVDTVTDFQAGIDKIRLSSKAFKGLKAGQDVISSGYIVYDTVSGKLSFDADGSVNKAKLVDVAIIGSGLQLTSTDLIVI